MVFTGSGTDKNPNPDPTEPRFQMVLKYWPFPAVSWIRVVIDRIWIQQKTGSGSDGKLNSDPTVSRFQSLKYRPFQAVSRIRFGIDKIWIQQKPDLDPAKYRIWIKQKTGSGSDKKLNPDPTAPRFQGLKYWPFSAVSWIKVVIAIDRIRNRQKTRSNRTQISGSQILAIPSSVADSGIDRI